LVASAGTLFGLSAALLCIGRVLPVSFLAVLRLLLVPIFRPVHVLDVTVP
jgi:hypothetical protein